MEFICKANDFKRGVWTVEKAVAKSSAFGLQDCIMLAAYPDQFVTFIANDLEISIKCQVPASSVTAPGKAVVDGHSLSQLARKVQGEEIIVKVEDSRVAIKAGKSRFKWSTGDPENFIASDIDTMNTEAVEVESNSLAGAVRRVIYAVSKDSVKGTLEGVRVESDGERLWLVATDANRIAIAAVPLNKHTDQRIQIIVPVRALNEAARLAPRGCTWEIRAIDNAAVFKIPGRVEIASRVFEGGYPDWRTILGRHKTTFTSVKVDRLTLISAIERCSLVHRKAPWIKLTLGGENGTALRVSSQADERGTAQDEIPVQYEGPAFHACYQSQFLIEPLGASDAQNVTLHFRAPIEPNMHPLSIQFDDEFQYLTMPVRAA